jgi:hypothetical protein
MFLKMRRRERERSRESVFCRQRYRTDAELFDFRHGYYSHFAPDKLLGVNELWV